MTDRNRTAYFDWVVDRTRRADLQAIPELSIYSPKSLLDSYDVGISRGLKLVVGTHCSIRKGECLACGTGAIFFGANPNVPLPEVRPDAGAISQFIWQWRAAHGPSGEAVFRDIEIFNDSNVGPVRMYDPVRKFIVDKGYGSIPVFPLESVRINKGENV